MDKKEKYSPHEKEEGKRLHDFGNKTEKNMTREEEKDKRRYNLGICLFIFLDILLLGLIGITAYYMAQEKKIVVLRDADICVPCEDLRIHPDDSIEGVERRGEDNTICCMKEKENSDILIGYYIDHWLKEKLATDDRKFTRYECNNGKGASKPTIKLVGRTKRQTAEHHKILWDGESDSAIVPIDKSITHHVQHGFIEIKKSGLYQVYSQIVLDHDMNAPDPHNTASLYQHYVIRIEAGEFENRLHEQALLKASNSHCSSKSDRQTITSYIGGAFQLSEGDRLAVKVHNKRDVVPVPHMNFFGAHML